MSSDIRPGLPGSAKKQEEGFRRLQLHELLAFLLPSLLGLFLFMIPLSYQGTLTIFVAIAAKFLEEQLKPWLPLLPAIMIVCSAVCSTMVLIFRPRLVLRSPFFGCLLNVGFRWTMVRIGAAAFALAILLKTGPSVLTSDKTGAFVLTELAPVLFCVFAVAGLFLPLLLNFGLIEFFGVLLARLMRPVFTLPGRSSIDCLASWVGDGTIGVLLTARQYEEGYYTRREAAVIGTTFSLVSVTFSMVVLTQVRLEHLFPQFYLTIFLSGFVAALILPRIYPLSKVPDVCIDGSAAKPDEKPRFKGFRQYLRFAIQKGADTALLNPGWFSVLKEGLRNVLDMWLGVLPTVLCFGTLALAVAEYTDLFHYLGMPFVPLLKFLHVPDAEAVAPAIVLGFADMFLPSVVVSPLENEMTRFVVACLSVSQLIYMSEVGSVLLSSKIPVNFRDLCLIFLLRTVITLPVIVFCARMIF